MNVMMTIPPTPNDSLHGAAVNSRSNTPGTESAGYESADHHCRSKDQIELTIELDFDGFTNDEQFSCD